MLQVINSAACLVLSIVVQDCIGVCPAKGSLYLQHGKHTPVITHSIALCKALVLHLENCYMVYCMLLTS